MYLDIDKLTKDPLEKYLLEDLVLMMDCFSSYNFCGLSHYSLSKKYKNFNARLSSSLYSVITYIENNLLDYKNYHNKKFYIDFSDIDIWINSADIHIIFSNDKECNIKLKSVNNDHINIDLYLGYFFYCDLEYLICILIYELEKYNNNIKFNKPIQNILDENEFIFNLGICFDHHRLEAFINDICQCFETLLEKLKPDNIEHKIIKFIEHIYNMEYFWTFYYNMSKMVYEALTYDDQKLETIYNKYILDDQINFKRSPNEIKSIIYSKYLYMKNRMFYSIMDLYTLTVEKNYKVVIY